MSDRLRERLRSLEGLLGLSKGAIVRGRELSEQKRERAAAQADWARSLGGRELVREEGACLLFEHRFGWQERWGDASLAQLSEIALDQLPLLASSDVPPPARVEEIAFIDVESTGLFGGTGTYAFLVAVGGIEPEGLVVRQYFMRDFHEEPAQLAALDEGLSRYTCLCSFNGRAFDAPLLAGRFITQRKRFAPAGWPHYDVLFPARRLWRARLGDCSLSNLEAEVFGFLREDDIPGELIPRVYFNFVRGRDLSDMSRVVRHNACDVVTTAMLLSHLSRARELAGRLQHAVDLASLARWMAARGELETARASYRRVLEWPRLERGLWWECSRQLSLLYTRAAAWDDALALWRAMARAGARLDPFPYEELAKYYEHRAREPRRALEIVDRLLSAVALAAELGRPGDFGLAALEHRRARLLRKLAGTATADDDLLEE
ncbi:ribonuclease H-like domain-containing protein [bacterium]|nr:ribonuclease H-like domain-containing protein [bacterium]